jgi:hypothetical protein
MQAIATVCTALWVLAKACSGAISTSWNGMLRCPDSNTGKEAAVAVHVQTLHA